MDAPLRPRPASTVEKIFIELNGARQGMFISGADEQRPVPPATVNTSAMPSYTCSFTSELFRIPGDGGWVFATVPPEHAPGVSLGWGRTPVTATVDGRTWQTSVWREKSGRTLLAVPKRIRGSKDHMDFVEVELAYDVVYRS